MIIDDLSPSTSFSLATLNPPNAPYLYSPNIILKYPVEKKIKQCQSRMLNKQKFSEKLQISPHYTLFKSNFKQSNTTVPSFSVFMSVIMVIKII